MVESFNIVRFICDMYVYTIFAILRVIIWETIKTEYYLVFCDVGSNVLGGDKDIGPSTASSRLAGAK